MSIIHENVSKTFHLRTQKTSYILKVLESKHLSHLYWGKKLRTNNLYMMRKRLII
ncbi:hypothetical protein [Clostridium butyricum]|uniref:hypothetical protein n=1 Tax=Clostridium butyricum TaxID=1492 RepID=UPI001494A1A5|nr:hypothetical protein [Clostridium butyricum]NOW21840.1 alpha-galactosidase [Clostridium butyricum]